MSKQYIPRISPVMLRDQPDQVCSIINQLIDRINELTETDLV